jgi:hypothetical protein
VQLASLTGVRRDTEMVTNFSKVIKAKEDQLVMKD